MISREEAKQRYVSKALCPAQSIFIINEIYDSIGSCGECKHLEYCMVLENIEEVTEVKYDRDVWFCADFERKEQ